MIEEIKTGKYKGGIRFIDDEDDEVIIEAYPTINRNYPLVVEFTEGSKRIAMDFTIEDIRAFNNLFGKILKK